MKTWSTEKLEAQSDDEIAKFKTFQPEVVIMNRDRISLTKFVRMHFFNQV